MDKNGYSLCAALIVYDNQATSPAVVPWEGFTWVTLGDVAANYVKRLLPLLWIIWYNLLK